MTQSPIKVLLVEDSPVAMGLYQRLVDSSPEVKVVGTAADGRQALNLIPQLQPQVIVTDLQMPVMDGMELIKQVMAKYPLPIMVLSNVVQKTISTISSRSCKLEPWMFWLNPKQLH